MKVITPIKAWAVASAFSFLPLQSSRAFHVQPQNDDEFLRTSTLVSIKGTSDFSVLRLAPDSDVYINSVKKKASIVVDLNNNVLYKYDVDGKPVEAFLVASGKKSTPTDPGVRIVSHVESYPYKTAPYKTKRRRNPGAYGPRIIILNKLNTINGEQYPCGEFIHGNKDVSSIGKYASQGCIRMDNEVIKRLSKQVKRGDIVKIIK